MDLKSIRKVFVSSTVYDLLDARAEVEYQLRDMGLEPVLSGSSTSAFQPVPDKHAIESCLVNLRHCDAVIVLLCQRYGPSLAKVGFDDLSATHLEYKEAKRSNKPIFMYVRDRTEADFNIAKKNRGQSVALSWVERDDDRRLFEILKDHRMLAQDKQESNWFDTFRDTIELKTLIRRSLGLAAARTELEHLVMAGLVPMLDLRVDANRMGLSNVVLKIKIRNLGPAAAYNIHLRFLDQWAGVRDSEFPFLGPQQETHQSLLTQSTDIKLRAALEYTMSQGHIVADSYTIGFVVNPAAEIYGATSHEKEYRVRENEDRPFKIVDPM